MRSRRLMIAVVVAAAFMFAVLGFLSWKAKYGRGRTVAAVIAGDMIVVQQRVVGQGVRGPVAQDRLVSIAAFSGEEVRRTTVLRGELVGTHDYDAVYRVADQFVLFDAYSLESRRSPSQIPPPPLTRYGAMVDLGDSLLLLGTLPGGTEARASKLNKDDKHVIWTAELPWRGHDTRLVAVIGQYIVIVDSDGMAALDRQHGGIRWVRP